MLLACSHVLQVKHMGGSAAVSKIPLKHIPHPSNADSRVTLSTLAQAAQQRTQTAAVSAHKTGDSVQTFGEAAAAAGFLGRFPGSEVMPLVQQFTGRLA